MTSRRGIRFLLPLVTVLLVFLALVVPGTAIALDQVEVIVDDAETGARLEGAAVTLHRVTPYQTLVGFSDVNGWVGFTHAMISAGNEYYITVDGPGSDHRTYQGMNFTFNGAFKGSYFKVWQNAHRVWGPDRYTTAVQTARTAFGNQMMDRWPYIGDVVIASGEDAAAADPLTAAGICWAYDAPLLLVGRDHTPESVKQAVAELANGSGHVTVHIVGGPSSVPNARYQDLVDYVGDPTKLTMDRIGPYANRFELASSVAVRMKHISDTVPAKTMTSITLIANGNDPDKFFDALALSPITAQTGAPILLVGEDYVPNVTLNRIAALGFPRVIVGGGPATVNTSVYAAVGATDRWWGNDRYLTAAKIATNAKMEGALGDLTVGVAAKLPDALTGGATTGLLNGALVLTQTGTLPACSHTYIDGCG